MYNRRDIALRVLEETVWCMGLGTCAVNVDVAQLFFHALCTQEQRNMIGAL